MYINPDELIEEVYPVVSSVDENGNDEIDQMIVDFRENKT